MVTIVFSSSNTWSSKVISWFMGSRISHCGIGGLVVEGTPMILHSNIGGVRLIPRTALTGTVVYEFEIQAQNLENNVADAINEIGKPYDYISLIGYAIVLLGRWLKAQWKNPFTNPNAFVCSKFVLGLDKDGDILEWNSLDLNSTTPDDLLKACNSNSYGTFKKLI